MNSQTVLVFNVGSSSLKIAAFLGDGHVEKQQVSLQPGQFTTQFHQLLDRVGQHYPHLDFSVGHRVVHGGMRFTEPVRITPEILDDLRGLIPLAPLHIPQVVEMMAEISKRWPKVPQVACFDTAFHHTLADNEKRFGIPRRYHDKGIRRFGFHGLSYQSIIAKIRPLSQRASSGRTVICHLGSGASLCGMVDSKSVTTSMGFTPLDGLLMCTRPGRIDPGVLLYLLEHEKLTLAQLGSLLEHESGLLGVSGISSDMQKLLANPSTEAQEAVNLFCHMAAKEIAAAAVAIGGLDAIVYTAGIGEHAPKIRQSICHLLNWLGVRLDVGANTANRERINAPESAIEVWRLETDEESIIAQETRQVLVVASGQ